jgi:Zn finger protein HypA/HybF involved in hydrogenase expression
MHELVYAHKIIEEARKKGDINAISLEVGDLASITTDEIKNAVETITGWAVNVKAKGAMVKCHCGFVGAPVITERSHDLVHYECPSCCNNFPDIVEGNEIKIKEVTVND